MSVRISRKKDSPVLTWLSNGDVKRKFPADDNEFIVSEAESLSIIGTGCFEFVEFVEFISSKNDENKNKNKNEKAG